jgi:hypothetical protein
VSASTVPGVLAGLVALARAALPGWAVFDGPPDTQSDQDYFAVGWHDEEAAVSSTASAAGLVAVQESYDVRCMASAWTGDDDPVSVRTRVYAAQDAFASAVDVDSTLGGVAAQALVTDSELTQQLQSGSLAALTITVHIEAFRS